LFLTIDTLRWFETPQSETVRYAPLLLFPVEMVYKKGSSYIQTRDEEISLNITLMEFLHQNYDFRIDGLDPLPRDASKMDLPQYTTRTKGAKTMGRRRRMPARYILIQQIPIVERHSHSP